MMDYNVLSSYEDYDAWHADRAEGVTASEMAALYSGGHAAWTKLKAEKQGLASRWKGNSHTAWGHEREPHILEHMRQEWGIEPNDHVLQSVDNLKHLGTPDGFHPSKPILGEAKTSVGDEWLEVPKDYLVQAMWNLHVTGAETMFLCVEYYDEREDGAFVARTFAPHRFIIERDDSLIEYLVSLAEKFLTMGEVDPMDALLARRLEAMEVVRQAKADQNAVDAEIFAEIGDKDSYKHVSDLGSVSLSKPKPRNQFMAEKFKENHPDLYDDFTVEGRVPKPSLRVTPAKKEAL